MTQRSQKIVYLTGIIIFILFCVLVGYYVGVPMIRFLEEPEAFRAWVDASGIWGRILFVGMVVFQVIVAWIPGEAVELAGGYAFGVLEGTILSMVGIGLGSWLIFLLVRRFGVKLVEVFFSRDRIREVSFLKNRKKTKVLAFLLMLIPGTPKDFLSYFAGLTGLNLREWLLIVLVARIPSVLSSSATGAAAGSRNYLLAGIIYAATAVMSLIGILYYRRLCISEKNDSGTENEAA